MRASEHFHAFKFIPLLFMGLFYGFVVGPPGLYNTEFLVSRGFNEHTAGFAFAFASVFSIALLAVLPLLLTRFGARRMLMGITFILTLAVLIFSFADALPVVALSFLLFAGLPVVIYAVMDLFMEARVDGLEGTTGRARGLYLLAVNTSFTLGPVIAGMIIARYSFAHLYVFAALMCLPFLYTIRRATHRFHDPPYPHTPLLRLMRTIMRDHLAMKALAINFLLQMRYAIVVVYLALYLHEALHFDIATIGLMVTISNITFLLIEYPLGVIGDRWLGERELLVLGFITTAFGGFMLAFIPTTSPITMTGILAVMFAGAAIIEIMSESYFFKHIRSKNDGHIAAFRMLIPLSYIVGPLFGTVIFFFFPMHYVFAAVAALCLVGIPLSLSLKDTR